MASYQYSYLSEMTRVGCSILLVGESLNLALLGSLLLSSMACSSCLTLRASACFSAAPRCLEEWTQELQLSGWCDQYLKGALEVSKKAHSNGAHCSLENCPFPSLGLRTTLGEPDSWADNLIEWDGWDRAEVLCNSLRLWEHYILIPNNNFYKLPCFLRKKAVMSIYKICM